MSCLEINAGDSKDMLGDSYHVWKLMQVTQRTCNVTQKTCLELNA